MSVWAIVLLGVDLVLMGSIIYLLLFQGNFLTNLINRSFVAQDGKKDMADAVVMGELREELSKVRKIAAELHKNEKALENRERALMEQDRKLDKLISRASGSAKHAVPEAPAPDNEELYSKATRMMKAGIPVEEVIKSLGIMRGEAELLSTLSGMRS